MKSPKETAMNPTALHYPRRHWPALTSSLLALMWLPVQAFDYQIHGFAAQGFSVSQSNQYFGDSTHGSADYYELGLNGAASLQPNLIVSAQGLLRRAGGTDTDGLRLDFAQIDYRFLSADSYGAGLRLGRVKNPYGFFNETRDVIFTRPGISLPNSVYLDSEGVRSILFSRNGTQLYGDWQIGEHVLSFEGNVALNSKLTEKEKDEIFGSLDLPVSIDVRDLRAIKLEDDWNGGTVKGALSYLQATLAIEPNPGVPLQGSLDASLWVASLAYNARRYSLTGEYQLTMIKSEVSAYPNTSTAGDGFYLQGDFHLTPHWTTMARYSATFENRHDRDGRTYAAQTGGDRYSQFEHDETIGINWQPDRHWGIWAEYHVLQGTAGVPAVDNIGRTLSDHWTLLQLMAAYRF